MADLKISLIENGLDFFLKAIECLEKEKPQDLKYAILHMESAVELVLKARLVSAHWVLIFKDPFKNGIELEFILKNENSASEHEQILILKKTPSKNELEKFKEGNFQSVDFQGVQQRLESICKVDLIKHKQTLNRLRTMRNKIQHFDFSGNTHEIESILVKTWSFLWDFTYDHLSEEINKHQTVLKEIKKRMLKHEKIVKHRRNEIEPKLNVFKKKGYLVVDCPSCLEKETLFIQEEEEPVCYFCRYQANSEQVADDWATVFVGYPHTDPKERMLYPVLQECPECMSETALYFEDVSMIPPDTAWICFSCGGSGPPMVTCHSCGNEFPWEAEDIYTCSECREIEGNETR